MSLTVTTLKRQEVTGQVNFNSHTDVVVGVAVALVNLLTEGEDRSRKYLPPDGDQRAEKITALFRSAGGRRAVTVAEAEVFGSVAAALREVFEHAERPLSIGELLEGASRRVDGMGVATVYRTVSTLLDEGWIQAVEIPVTLLQPFAEERDGLVAIAKEPFLRLNPFVAWPVRLNVNLVPAIRRTWKDAPRPFW